MNIRLLQSAVGCPKSSIVRAAVGVALLFVTVGQLSSQAVASQQSAVGGQLTLLAKDGRRTLAITVMNGQEFVSLDELATVFQLAVREESLGALTVSYKGKTIVLTPDQALASVAGRLVSLPAPPARSGRRWMVPVDFIGRALVLIYDARLDLRPASHLLVIGDLRVPRITIRYDTVSSGGRLTIDATPRATSAVRGEGSERLTIKFDADALDLPSIPGSQGLVEGIQVADATTLTVALASRVIGYRASTQAVDAVERLTLDLRVAQTEAPLPSQASAPPPAAPAAPSPAQTIAPVRTLATIVIDPGHGGEDKGAEGPGGTKEKDVALAVATQLKTAIEGRLGARVLLTRDDDRQLSIDDRTSFANNNKADLFISLHANASLRMTTAGASIYCAAFDRGPDPAIPTAKVERAPVVGGGVRDIELVAWNRAQTRHLNRSLTFAAALEQVFHDRVPLAARVVNRAPLKILESANMPAVLVEMGFLSNPEQEKQLASSDFQAAFVQAATDAVVRFRDAPPPAGGAR